jgi:hypothetical protein
MAIHREFTIPSGDRTLYVFEIDVNRCDVAHERLDRHTVGTPLTPVRDGLSL